MATLGRADVLVPDAMIAKEPPPPPPLPDPNCYGYLFNHSNDLVQMLYNDATFIAEAARLTDGGCAIDGSGNGNFDGMQPIFSSASVNDGTVVWRATTFPVEIRFWDPVSGEHGAVAAASGFSFTLPAYHPGDGYVYFFEYQGSGSSAGTIRLRRCLPDLTGYTTVSEVTLSPGGQTRSASSTHLAPGNAYFEASQGAGGFWRCFPLDGGAITTPGANLGFPNDVAGVSLVSFHGWSGNGGVNVNRLWKFEGDTAAPSVLWPDPAVDENWRFLQVYAGFGLSSAYQMARAGLKSQMSKGYVQGGSPCQVLRAGNAAPAPGGLPEARFQTEANPAIGKSPTVMFYIVI